MDKVWYVFIIVFHSAAKQSHKILDEGENFIATLQ